MDHEIIPILINARCYDSSSNDGLIPVAKLEALIKNSFEKFASKIAKTQARHEQIIADKIAVNEDDDEILNLQKGQPHILSVLDKCKESQINSLKSKLDGEDWGAVFEIGDGTNTIERSKMESKLKVDSDLKTTFQRFLSEIVIPLEVLDALNEARAQPRKVAEDLKLQRLPRYGKDKVYQVPAEISGVGKERNIVTKEGKEACQDAINYCAKLNQEGIEIPELFLNPVITLVAEDHADDIGKNGVVSHKGSDGETDLWTRMTRYVANENMATGECLWYGKPSYGKEMITDLIVDDGVPSRGHRLGCFEKRYHEIGISLKQHKTFGHVLCMDFASKYGFYNGDCVEGVNQDEIDLKITKRVEHGPVQLQTRKNSKGQADMTTQWASKKAGNNSTMGGSKPSKSIGTCGACGEEIRGGSVIEAKGARYHADCFKCSVESCGKKLAGVPYLIENTQLYCKDCHTENFGKKCAGCKKAIGGKMLTAINKQNWHPECFNCAECGKNCATQNPKVKWVVVPEIDANKPTCSACVDKRNNANSNDDPSSSSKLGIPNAGKRPTGSKSPRPAPGGAFGGMMAAPKAKGEKGKAKAKVSMGGAQSKVQSLGMSYADF